MGTLVVSDEGRVVATVHDQPFDYEYAGDSLLVEELLQEYATDRKRVIRTPPVADAYPATDYVSYGEGERLRALRREFADRGYAVDITENGGPDTAKDWVTYDGPWGGSGWQNVQTGDVHYKEEPPDDAPDPDDLTLDPGEQVPTHVTISWGEHPVGFARIQNDELRVAYTGSNNLVSRIVRTMSTGEVVPGDEGDDPYDQGLIEIEEDRDFTPERRMRELILVLNDLPGVALSRGHTAKAAIMADVSALFKEWVPYTGPRGGEGWRNTSTGEIRYGERPDAETTQFDTLSDEAIAEADIQQTWAHIETTADDVQDGEVLRYDTGEYEWDVRVEAVTDNAIIGTSTETQRSIRIPVGPDGEPQDDDASIRALEPVFLGSGVAGAESSWLPDEGRPTDRQLRAEALRSAAEGTGFGETSYLESFAARASDRGVDRARVMDALQYALEEHPLLNPDYADEIFANGQRLLDIEDDLTDEKARQVAKRMTPARPYHKEWIPYEGPRGGEGWLDPARGEVRYTDDPPGEREVGSEGQTQTTLDTGTQPEFEIEEPRWLTDEVARISVYRALGEDVYDEILARYNRGELMEYEDPPYREVDEFDLSAEMWLGGAKQWIEDEGTGEHAAALQQHLDQYDTTSPWGAYTDDISAPAHLNPENADEIVPFHETGIDGGISAESMWIAKMDSGDRVFVTNVNDKVGPDERGDEMQAAEDAAAFLTELGYSTPEHHYEEGQFLAVEEVDGDPVGNVQLGHGGPPINERTYIEFAAAQILIGNRDAHSTNVFIDWMENEPVAIDLDRAGYDLTRQGGRLDTGLGKLYDNTVELGISEPYNDDDKAAFKRKITKRVGRLARSDGIEDALEAIEDDGIRMSIKSNIEAARSGDLITDETNVWSSY